MKKLLPNLWPRAVKADSLLKEAVLRQQHAVLRQTLPFLYIVYSIGVGVFSFTFWQQMPPVFYIYVPSVLFLFFFLRLVYWSKYFWAKNEPELSIIKRDLRGVTILGSLLNLGYLGFVLTFLNQGPSDHITAIAFTVWTAALVSSFCINAIPATSFFINVSSSILISTVAYLTGDTVMIRLSAVYFVFSLLAIGVNTVIYRAFIDNVIARWKLARKNEVAEKARIFATNIAFSDPLTGLPNRRSFLSKLQQKIDLIASDRIDRFGVAIVDLDGFKPVNDIHGHAVGDAVLIEVGERLASVIGDEGFVARLGGDEFAIIADNIGLEEDATELGERLCDSLRAAFVAESVSAHLSGSCGFCLVRQGRSKPGRVIERADLALYKAKALNRGGTVVFSVEMAETAMRRSKTEQALRKAIADDSIEVHFQPIVDLSDGRILGMEALARWEDSDLGTVSPARFIPIAEQTGLIAELTENLFQRAIVAAKCWPDDIFLSFNLSADHLTRPSVGLKILSTMLHHGFNPKKLEIEVTETAIMKDVQRARTTITNLKQAGVKIALDDFGAGYSSMGQIRDLPFDKIKIDKSFVDGVCDSKRTRSLISSIIDMCFHLDISCVAEGIESKEQHIKLCELGCMMGQGFLFARSMTQEEFLTILDGRDWARLGQAVR